MKRLSLYSGIVLLGVACILSIESYAQSKIITSRDYYAGLGDSRSKVYQRSRRVETTEETLASGLTTRSVVSVTEVQLPSHSRYYSKTVEGGRTTELEQITIDYMHYTRKDGGDWTKIDLRSSATLGGTGDALVSPRRCDQYSAETAFLAGRVMRLFTWISIDAFSDELMFRETRKWIGEDGFPYREEDVRGKLSPRDETNRTTTTYDYEPRIKIEAPVK